MEKMLGLQLGTPRVAAPLILITRKCRDSANYNSSCAPTVSQVVTYPITTLHNLLQPSASVWARLNSPHSAKVPRTKWRMQKILGTSVEYWDALFMEGVRGPDGQPLVTGSLWVVQAWTENSRDLKFHKKQNNNTTSVNILLASKEEIWEWKVKTFKQVGNVRLEHGTWRQKWRPFRCLRILHTESHLSTFLHPVFKFVSFQLNSEHYPLSYSSCYIQRSRTVSVVWVLDIPNIVVQWEDGWKFGALSNFTI